MPRGKEAASSYMEEHKENVSANVSLSGMQHATPRKTNKGMIPGALANCAVRCAVMVLAECWPGPDLDPELEPSILPS